MTARGDRALHARIAAHSSWDDEERCGMGTANTHRLSDAQLDALARVLRAVRERRAPATGKAA